MSKEELAMAYLGTAFDKAVDKVGAAVVAESLVSDAQKPLRDTFEFWWVEHMPRSGQRAAFIAWRDAQKAVAGITAPPKLTPPDGWADGIKWSERVVKIQQAGANVGPSLAAMSKVILDMDAKLKEVKP